MVNEIEGAKIRREWRAMDSSLKQFMQTNSAVSKETRQALRQQALNIKCGNLYVWSAQSTLLYNEFIQLNYNSLNISIDIIMSFLWKIRKQAPVNFMPTEANQCRGLDVDAGLDGLCLSEKNSHELIVNFLMFLFF